ncbi:TPMT family class I SAM-dependent methyltransferase [Paraburkholderia sp. MMS20-SJTN17]|uniref:TPMT family class I SAM-dependent methyltransferase n=1 Tax=Paraburkholderia translucens TaxID=2886945 RepID=A0ABS8KHG0_9BURK|nr:methyltransferase domain-containing protein [Paraburkholderia sp. MMS20-SJTN17]MCC8404180.1 TPMT family class I SAM-dependent methyltransferase [Paraburkholderia sp. MMS20-SJTN17]
MSDPTQPSVPDFATRDPNSPEFWDERFERRFTPWDQAGVPSAFRAFAARHRDAAVLIPGCGSAHEAVWLARQGTPVRAIDFSPAAVAAAREQLGAQHASLVEQADFFTYAPPFAPAWIYERAFFCALPPARRTDYAQRMAELLPAGALLAGFFFMGATPKGPPFGIERGELDALLTPHFELIEDEAVDDSIAVFAGRERWLTWRRRG